MELRPCPFCGLTKIRLSIKTAGRRNYHACYYCSDCHIYGPRTLFKPEINKWYSEASIPQHIKDQAAELWNRRFSESDATITIDDIKMYGAAHRDELLEEYNKRKTSN